VATATAAIVVLTPSTFYHFRRPKSNLQPLSFTFETFGKNKIVSRVKNQSRKYRKGFEITCNEAATIFLTKILNTLIHYE
jgi:hypothetical protein